MADLRTRLHNFNRHGDEIEDLLPVNPRFTGQKRNKFVATYDTHTDGNTGFFDGYVNALHRAMVDLAFENTPLIELLDELFAEALLLFLYLRRI